MIRSSDLLLLEMLFEHAPLGIAFIGRDFRYRRVNARLAAIHGMAAADHDGQLVSDVVPALWASLEPLYQRVLAGEAVVNQELTGLAAPEPGPERDWLFSLFPVREGEEVVGIGVILNDITERRRAELALEVRDRLYAMLVKTNQAVARCRTRQELYQEACTIAVGVGGFRYAWVGVPEGDRLRRTAEAGEHGGYMDELVIPLDEHDPRSQGPTGRAARTGGWFVVNDFLASTMTASWHEKAKQVGFGSSAAFPLKERGAVVGVLSLYAGTTGFFSDALVGALSEITPSLSIGLDRFAQDEERRRLEDQYRQAQKMEAIGQLAGGVAHDFNNLLTVINGYADLLLSRLPPDDPLGDVLGHIHRAGDRAAALTRQLLAFSRRQVIEPRVLVLNAVITDTDRMLRRMIGEDVTVVTELEPALDPVMADEGQVSQVLLNLAVNARDAMTPGGRLTIGTDNVVLDQEFCRMRPGVPPGAYVRLRVSDTGCGMDQQTQARIFEPFFTTKATGKGTGLGLATVHGIVQQAGGHIEVRSAPGQGTTFDIFLPRAAAANAADQSPSHEGMPHGTETILLVEDEQALRVLARHILRGCGYDVVEAANGAEALAAAEARGWRIDLLVSDVVMPEVAGRELATRLTGRQPACKVLFMSGYMDDELLRHGVEAEQYPFLPKPFTPAALAQHVRRALDAR